MNMTRKIVVRIIKIILANLKISNIKFISGPLLFYEEDIQKKGKLVPIRM